MYIMGFELYLPFFPTHFLIILFHYFMLINKSGNISREENILKFLINIKMTKIIFIKKLIYIQLLR